MENVAELIERGVLAYVTGKIPEAVAVFRQVLEVDPDNAKARGYLILVQATHPDLAAAGAPRTERKTNPPAPSQPVSPPPPAPAPLRALPAPAPPEPLPPPPAPAPPRPAPTAASFALVPSPPIPASERVFELPAPRPERPSRSQPRPALDLAALLESEAAPEAPPGPLEPSAFAPATPTEPGPAAPPPELVSAPPAPAGGGDPDYAPSPWDDGPTTGATIVLSDEVSGGLDLAAVAEKSDLRPLVPQGTTQGPAGGPPTDVDLWLRAAKELFALGDFTGSLELIEKILTVDPDHGEARDYLRQNEATLVSMYESKLGPLQATPRLAIKPEEVMWLNLDHRAGFLLAQIDGSVDYEGLFAVSGLPRLDTARILANLIADGVVKS